MEYDGTIEKVTFPAGTVIFKEGAWEMWLYRIETGKVGIYANYGSAEEQLLTELGPEKIFGELGLIEFRTRSATAVALEETVAEKVDDKVLSYYLQKDPEQALAVWKNMCNRIRELSHDYDEACSTIEDYLSERKADAPRRPGVWQRILHLIEESHKYDGAVNDAPELFDEMARMRGMNI